MRLILHYTWFLVGLGLGERFISPGPGVTDQTPNAVYPVGSKFYIAWADTNTTRPVSIVLFQTHDGELVYPFEYIEQRLTDRESTEWTVVTTKDLELSNAFLLNLFYDGDSGPAAVSQSFNITDSRKISTTTPSPSFTSQLTATAASTTSASPLSTTTEAPSEENTGGGLSTGAKVGVGVAIPVVVALGIAMGYFLNTYLTKRSQSSPTTDPASGQIPMVQKYELGPGAGHSHELGSHHQFSGIQDTNRGPVISAELYSDATHR